MVGDLGHHHGDALLSRSSLSRTEGGPGVRGSHPYRHHRRRRIYTRQAQEPAGRERNHPEHRCLLGHHRSRSHLHAASHLHPAGKVSGDERLVCQGVHVVAARRHPRHPVHDSVPQILCEGHARQVSFPRSHSHHAGARERSQGRRSG